MPISKKMNLMSPGSVKIN